MSLIVACETKTGTGAVVGGATGAAVGGPAGAAVGAGAGAAVGAASDNADKKKTTTHKRHKRAKASPTASPEASASPTATP